MTEKNTVSYWRGTVDSRLQNLSKQVEELQGCVEDIEKQVTRIDKKLGNGSTFIEWQFIREKLAVPIVLAFLTFLLFTVLPAVLVLIYFIPKIAGP